MDGKNSVTRKPFYIVVFKLDLVIGNITVLMFLGIEIILVKIVWKPSKIPLNERKGNVLKVFRTQGLHILKF